MATYRCNWRVDHNGTPYAPGDEIELYPDEAAPLLASGAISTPEKRSALRRLFGDSDGVNVRVPAEGGGDA